MKHILLFIFSLNLFGSSSFITQMEYASQLYKNPRGIGCHHCHGADGEGKLIATYIEKDEKKSFIGPVINQLDFKTFYLTLNQRIDGMPRYFLTQKEIEALYHYLQQSKVEKNVK